MMRHQLFVASILLGCVVSLAAQTAPPPQIERQNPKSDWRMVQSIEPGTAISIQARGHWHHCDFDRAEAAYVECSPHPPERSCGPLLPRPRALHYDRASVTKIRIDKTIDSSGLLGGLIGAGAGVALGAIRGGNGDTTLSGGLMIGGGLGALFGGVTGSMFPFHHSVVIYEYK